MPQTAQPVRGDQQTVRNAIHACNRQGLDALPAGSSRPRTTDPTFDPAYEPHLAIPEQAA